MLFRRGAVLCVAAVAAVLTVIASLKTPGAGLGTHGDSTDGRGGVELMAEAKTRAAARGWVTRAKNRLEVVLAVVPVDVDALEDALEDFDRRLDRLDNVQSEYEVTLDDAELEIDIDEAATFRDSVKLIRIKAAKIFNTKSSSGAAGISQAKSEKCVKLPKFELPKFSGNVLEWQGFWDKYEASIHNSDLPDINKFTYLQTYLEGEAKAAVQGLSVTAAHYQIAIDILKKRFGRKSRIIFAHVQALLNISLPQHKNAVAALWQLQDELQAHVRSLAQLGVDGTQYGVILTPVVLSRLPADIRIEWAREGEERESDLEWLLHFLNREISCRERSSLILNQKSDSSVQPANNNIKKYQTNGSATSLVSNSSKGAAAPVVCAFCHKKHASERCWEVQKLSESERYERVKRADLCFRCLGKNHQARGCFAKCSKCEGRHHVILCNYKSSNVAAGNHRTSQNNTSKHTATQLHTATQQTGQSQYQGKASMGSSRANREILLQCAKVSITDNTGSVQHAIVMFDSGSDRSYVSSSLVQKVCPTFVEQQNVAFASFGSKRPSNHEMRNVFSINFENGHDILATEIPVISAPIHKPKIPGDILQSFGELDWVYPDFYEETERLNIDILIGLDAYWKLIMPGIRKVDNDGLVAQQTVFGWILSGIVSAAGNYDTCVTSTQLLCLEDLPDDHLTKLWDLDAIGIHENSEALMMDPVHTKFLENVSFQNGRYQVELPFKDNISKLLDNENQAHIRLNILNKKLDKDPALKQRYSDVFIELEDLGIIEEVPDIDIPDETGNQTFYMPHRPIVKEERVSSKVRPVFDASAKGYNKMSLNDCMESGPNLIPNLSEILIRFRRWKIAFTADITKAFLQIDVKPEHRDVHRFLLQDSDKVRVMRFVRLPFGNKSSPFLLNATIKHHLSKYEDTPVIQEMKDNFYMDDLITGCDYEDEVCQMTVESKSVMADASMCLTKCNSSSKQVYEIVSHVFDESPQTTESVKVLGMKWLASIDCLSFDGICMPGDMIVTKRLILSCIARLFDPLGICTPFVMTAKILFQEAWRLGLSWNEKAPQEITTLFEDWCQQLTIVKQWNLPRSYTGYPWCEIDSISLHGFGDASAKAYGACVYLVATHRDTGLVTSSLVFAKARVAPLKRLTLPRMELLSALLCARLVKFVHKALRLSEETECNYWSDSTVALAWLKGDPFRWKTFVSNRVIEIQQISDTNSWKHCPGEMNPADLVTRGISAADLMQSSLWVEGPGFIREKPCFFVVKPENSCDDTVKSEMKKLVSSVNKTSTTMSPLAKLGSPVLDLQRWSTFEKCLRIIAWIFRFMHNAQAKGVKGDLTYDEITNAKTVLFKYVQTVEYSKEFEAIKADRMVSKGSAIYKLSPFIDQQGIIRVGGRLQSSGLGYSEKHPIVLPKGHLSLLLVRFQHLLMKHAGVENMLVTLRNTVWIVGARRLAKKVKRECVHCQRVDAKPLNPPMPPLPELRVKEAPPFSVVGLDFGGPLYSSDCPGQKYYILLFTCAVVRSVHLELTESLNVHDFSLAFRKFVSRRGMPTTVYSDNAKTFKSFKTKFLSTYGSKGPNWKFIVPRAPWWGGFWERMIGSVKSALKKTLGLKSLSKSELETTLIEIEACINSRPLTFVGDEADSQRPITPNHFLTGRTSNFDQAEACDGPVNITHKDLVDKLSLQGQVMEEFWEIWCQSYIRNLPSYQGVTKSNKHGANDDLHEGSYVMIKEDNISRLAWPYGIVSQVIYGKDHVIRAAQIKTKTGVLTRPVQRLHKIELIPDVFNKADESVSNETIVIDSHDTGAVCDPTGKLPSGHISSGTTNSPSTVKVSNQDLQRTRYGRVIKPVVRF